MADDDEHLTAEDYDRLLRAELPPRRLLRRLFRHLLEVCPQCHQAWHHFRGSAPGDPSSFTPPREGPARTLDQAFDRVTGKLPKMKEQVERDRSRGKELLEELLDIPEPAQRVARVRRNRRFRSWALCELLFAQSQRVAFVDPVAAESLAELAIETSWSMDDGSYSREAVSDLLARSWAYLANARRMGSDLAKAEETILMAYFFVEQGTGDPLVHAEILSLEASLRQDQRLMEEALELLERVVSIYEEAGEVHLQGRTLLQVGLTYGYGGEPERAVEIIRGGLPLIEADREERLELCFRHTLAYFVNQAGRPEEASQLMHETAPLYDRFQDPWTQLRRRWLEGEIAEGLDDQVTSEACYREVREGFIEQGLGYDAALASLNLAAVLLEQGRISEIKALAGEMLKIFESRDLHREAIAALILFQKAASQEVLTLEMVQGFSRYLQRSRHDARLRYEAPS